MERFVVLLFVFDTIALQPTKQQDNKTTKNKKRKRLERNSSSRFLVIIRVVSYIVKRSDIPWGDGERRTLLRLLLPSLLQ